MVRDRIKEDVFKLGQHPKSFVSNFWGAVLFLLNLYIMGRGGWI